MGTGESNNSPTLKTASLSGRQVQAVQGTDYPLTDRGPVGGTILLQRSG